MANSQRCTVCSRPTQMEGYGIVATELCIQCETILRRLSDRLVPLYDIEPDRITLGTSWVEDLGADSLDRAELIVALEEEFGTKITNEETLKLEVVADLVRLLANRFHCEEFRQNLSK
jgi:acyl carrier protein